MNTAVRKGKGSGVRLFVTRSGSKGSVPDCQAAFESREAAIRFLCDLHGLDIEETRNLRKQQSLDMDRRTHGSEWCAVMAETMTDDQARAALSGELYLDRKRTA